MKIIRKSLLNLIYILFILILSLSCSNNDASDLKSQLLGAANVLGILRDSPENWLGIGKTTGDIDKDAVDRLIQERNEARQAKNFQRADEIRDKLTKMGIEIEDTPKGTIWSTK